MSISFGDSVSLAGFPGGDRPVPFRHSRHEDYEGEQPGYPDVDFVVSEPLTWQAERPGGPWLTRIRPRDGGDFLPAYLARVCDPKTCPRLIAKSARQRQEKCSCPLQLRVTLSTRTGRRTTEFYSRICGWVRDGMRTDGRRFTSDEWLRRRGSARVVVHHANPPVEHDAEDGPLVLKNDTVFAGLEPQTPAEHEAVHAALNKVLGHGADGAASRPARASAGAAGKRARDRDAAVTALVAEGLPRGRPPKKRRKGVHA